MDLRYSVLKLLQFKLVQGLELYHIMGFAQVQVVVQELAVVQEFQEAKVMMVQIVEDGHLE